VQRDPAGQVVATHSREYSLKDHLGNLRVAYRLEQRATYTAGLEPRDSTQEEQQFEYIKEPASRRPLPRRSSMRQN